MVEKIVEIIGWYYKLINICKIFTWAENIFQQIN
jgi:hypothetical protein